ncbi:acetolactate synthase-1/2/3 large subunit [Microbacterium sp. SORGH_AS 505]|uniref:thiamine pyrophosphate-binding protein n=1 Tax=Microbacterium sp. SORGH_AS_0505 TaxID=3041770 RepID=UPI0027891099|nr:thiamine pyrophosphate-binding protein [Microbacterium sp. SORGH_AS_0505]MDQ1125339.1 acetolactate synthase-1/2/3 large subunit [Microbacterium sp. SORGH_AS_0505]
MPTVAAHVAAALAAHVDNVFGVMGNGNALVLDALERRDDVTFTAVRHEAGGVVAADAHFRAGGGLAAATSTYGAGFTNTLTALAEAAQARVPLVLVVGDEPTSGPRPWDVDQLSLASAVGVRTYTVGRTDAAATTVIAIEHALSFRIPVVLAIPYDVGGRDAGEIPATPDPVLPAPLAPTGPHALATVTAVARALAASERPLLLAGRGAWTAGAGEQLGRLADAVGALTASTALGRGVFPRAEYDLGVTGGFGAEGAMATIREADVVVVFGASLNQFTMRFGELFSPDATIVQVDVAAAATHPQVGRYLRADAALAARALADELEQLGGAPSGWREAVDVAGLRTYDAGDGLAPDGRLDPRSAAAAIAELLPEDRVVVSDGGHFIGWANMFWPVASPDRMMMIGTAYQSIGLGFPSVPGAARARPESTIVLTTGDGGGLMAIADLESAVRVARGRGLAVVWNDGAYGAEVHLYGVMGLARGPMEIPEVDFAGLARAVGAEGVIVRTLDDLQALARWRELPADERPFLLLDLRVSGAVRAPYQEEILQVNLRR